MNIRPSSSAVAEAAVVGVGGAVLGAACGRLIEGRFACGTTVVFGAVGAVNGAIGGVCGIYDWRRARGWRAFALDSTWAQITTLGALGIHALSWGASRRAGGPEWVASLSRRSNRHVYARGFRPRRGFAFCVGNVITGAADRLDLDDGSARSLRRRRLIERHEDRHVQQARAFGPLYPLAYGGWLVAGVVAGSCAWLVSRPASLARCIETIAYYDNPFEYAAYRADGYWPPAGAVPELAWRPVGRDRTNG